VCHAFHVEVGQVLQGLAGTLRSHASRGYRAAQHRRDLKIDQVGRR
jgi:hypothetical protein